MAKRAKPATYTEIRETVTQLVDASRRAYGDYAYAAGFLESWLVEVLSTVPASKQQYVLEVFRTRKQGFDALK